MNPYEVLHKAKAQRVLAENRNQSLKQGGGYKFNVVLDADVDAVIPVVERYYHLLDRYLLARGLKKAVLTRRITDLEKELCKAGHFEPTGNLELVEQEIASGLLEPYDPGNPNDRTHIAGKVAEYAVAKQAEQSKNPA